MDTCEQAIRKAWSEIVEGSVIHKLDMVGRKLQVWSQGKYDKLGKQIEMTEKA